MTEPVLHLEGIVVRAGERPILDVEDFSISAGETLALIGPNGAGKSTLLHVAALLRHPDEGVVTVLGQTATRHRAAMLRRAISVVFQQPLLFDVSVLANAAAGLRFQGLSRREAESRARDWLGRFGVAHLATRRARRLSGGEASRVALARAFATEPALLLLDEPFTALDAPTRATLLPVLRQFLRETGTAAVFVTHDLAEAFAFGDRLALMQSGRIVARGEASALIARPPSRDVAELLGIENILTAQVIRSEGEAALVSFLPDGPPVWVETSADATYQPGQIVTFTVPAAAARALHPGDEFPPGSTCLSGPVVTSMPFPSGTRLVVQTPALVAAHAPWDHLHRNWVIGERAVIAIPRSAGHLVPDDP